MRSIALTLLTGMTLSGFVAGSQVEREQTFGDVHLVELHESEWVNPLFAVTGVEVSGEALHLTVTELDPGRVAALIAAGQLTAELSDQGGTTTTVSLALWRKCRCGGNWVPARYDAGQSCTDICGANPEEEQFFLAVPTTLPGGTDLAIGYEPSSLWLFERK